MTSIVPLHVRLGMDASNFSQGTEMARSEVNKVARVMQQSVPPAEKYQRDIELLNKTFSAAGRQTKEYQNAVDMLRKKYGQTAPEAKKFSEQVASLKTNPAFLATAGAIAAIGATVTATVIGLRNAQVAIDEQAKSARRLGLAYSELQGIKFAAGEIVGDTGAVETGIRQMQIRIAKAAAGDATISKAFAAIGVDAGKAMSAGPIESLKLIGKGFEGVTTQAERLNVANQLFGRQGAEMLQLLSAGSDTLAESIAFQEKWNSLTDAQVLGVEAANDAWGRLQTVATGVTNTVAAELAPVFEMMFKDVMDIADEFSSINDSAKGWAESITMGVGDLKDMAKATKMAADAIRNPAKFAAETSWSDIANTFDFSSGERDYMRLMQRRGELEFDAAQKAIDRENERLGILQESEEAAADLGAEFDKQMAALENQYAALTQGEAAAKRLKLEAEGYSDELIKQLEAMDSQIERAKERRKQEELTAKELERQAEAAKRAAETEMSSALKAAQDYFAKERQADDKRRQEVSKGPGSGIEAGSQQAAKFMADQVNQAIGAAAVPDKPTPGEDALLKESKRQFEEMQRQSRQHDQQIERLRELIGAVEDNGAKRI
jgi:hypothetical protein